MDFAISKKAVTSNGCTNGISNGHINGSLNGCSNGTSAVGEEECFLRKLVDLLIEEGMVKGVDRSSRVVEFVHPAELKQRLDLQLVDAGESDDRVLQLCADTLKYSVKTGHPYFFNQLYQGLDQYSIAGAWLTDAVNTSQYTYEVAPVFTLMEEAVIGQIASMIGFKTWDGLFCPGGSISNMYAINLARYRAFPQIKEEGMYGLPQLTAFTSAHSHYSIKKGMALMGLGTKNLVMVPCDSMGRMIPEELQRLVEESLDKGERPFFVNATAGTTVAGAYDPLDKLAEICIKHNIWLHVDGCWGGAVLLSKKYRSLLHGIERADSFAWNPHKMMGAPLQCSAFLTQHKHLLENCHSASARYLFQQDKFYDKSYDTGDKSIQCGRKVDVFKVWLMWKAYGNTRMEEMINNAFEKAQYLAQRVRNTEGFRLVYDQIQCTNVCFWYIPPSMRGQEETDEWWQRLGKVAPKIKERMTMEGTMLIGYQPQENFVNFFRMVVANLKVTHSDMDAVINECDRLGKDL